MTNAVPKTPWHLWVVGILGLLWNGMGGKNYVDLRAATDELYAAQAEGFGTTPEIVAAYYESYPLWAEIAYGFQVWAAIAGSILLLLRSRYAEPAFWLALIGFLVNAGHGVINPVEGTQNVGFIAVITIAIGLLIALQLYYAMRMRKAGVLR